MLDNAERGVVGAPRTVKELSLAVGVSRQTIWRSKDLRARIQQLGSSPQSTSSRRSNKAIIAALRHELAMLSAVNDKLVANFLVVARRLEDRNLNVVEIMGGAAENPYDPLPWDEE